MALKQMPDVGEKVRYLGGMRDRISGTSVGEIYEIIGISGRDTAVFDTGEKLWSISPTSFKYYELVTEESDQPAPSYADLFANIGARLYELEQAQTKRKEGEEMTETAHKTHYVSEKRHAKPGERIVVVAPLSNVVEQGDIFPVETVDDRGNASVDFGSYWVSPDEYEVLPAEMTHDKHGINVDAAVKVAREAGDTTEEAGEIIKRASIAQYQSPDNANRDSVEKPAHYTQGKFETIDMIAQIVAGYSDPFVGHCVGTAVKYVSRAPYKHDTPLEDMRKSKRYIEFAIERLEGGR